METLFTVLITLGVVAAIVTVVGVIRLMLRVKDLGHVRVEMDQLGRELDQSQQQIFEDIDKRVNSVEGNFHRDLEDLNRNVDQYISSSESNLDRRFDNVWDFVHKMNEVLNPNKDIIKN